MQSASVRSTQDGHNKKTKNLLLSLWVCGREASECGQAVGNVFLLSMACPYVPKGAGWSVGRVHISTGCFHAAALFKPPYTSAGVHEPNDW